MRRTVLLAALVPTLLLLAALVPLMFLTTTPQISNAWERLDTPPTDGVRPGPAEEARPDNPPSAEAPREPKVEFVARTYRQGTVTEVTKDSITIECPEVVGQRSVRGADGLYRLEPATIPALPPKRFPVSEALAAGKVPMETRLVPGHRPGVVPEYCMYRLADVKVGDWVYVLYSRVDGVDICDHIWITKRPGGRVPPLPEGVTEVSFIPYHERMNAYWDLEDKGIPYPEHFKHLRRWPEAPMPREVNRGRTPPPTLPAVRPPEAPMPPGVAGIPPPRAVVPAAPADELARLERAYGTWADADKDCKFKLTGDKLTVSLPAPVHLLGKILEGGTNNAPRALREVEGDFIAVVRVTIPIPERVPKIAWPYCSGGLVAWESEQGHVVARLCGGGVNGFPESIWCLRASPESNLTTVTDLGKPTGKAFVRIKREEKKVSAGWSRDGKKWKDYDPEEVTWGAKVKVGVVAENTLGKPVEVTFDQYELTQPKK